MFETKKEIEITISKNFIKENKIFTDNEKVINYLNQFSGLLYKFSDNTFLNECDITKEIGECRRMKIYYNEFVPYTEKLEDLVNITEYDPSDAFYIACDKEGIYLSKDKFIWNETVDCFIASGNHLLCISEREPIDELRELYKIKHNEQKKITILEVK